MRLKYRKGEATGGGILYFVFFFMVLLIVAGIYGGLISFFGRGYDYRDSESSILLQKVRECASRNDFDLNLVDKEEFFDKCNIDSRVIEDGNHLIYFKDNNGVEFFIGVADFKTRCGFSSRFKNLDMPLCFESRVKDIYFIVASSQNSRRVVL